MQQQIQLRQQLMSYKSVVWKMLSLVKDCYGSIDNIEPCPICYCKVQPSSHSLPNFSCPCCVGVFHKECINSWIRSSHSYNCPLCRQPLE